MQYLITIYFGCLNMYRVHRNYKLYSLPAVEKVVGIG